MTRTHRTYNVPEAHILKHSYKQVCMCRCPFCRDPKRETNILRRHRQGELIRIVWSET